MCYAAAGTLQSRDHIEETGSGQAEKTVYQKICRHCKAECNQCFDLFNPFLSHISIVAQSHKNRTHICRLYLQAGKI